MHCIKCDTKLKDEFIYCPYCGKKQMRKSAVPGKDIPLQRRARGTGSIRYLPNRKKPYQVRYRKNGALVSGGTFETLTQAQMFLNSIDIDVVSDRINATLGEVWESYTKSNAYKALTADGRVGVDNAWMRLSALKSRKMRELRKSDYQQLIDAAMKVPRYKVRTPAELAKMKPSEVERYKKLAAQPLEPLGYEGKHKIKILVSVLCQEAMGDNIIDTNYGELIDLRMDDAKVQRRNLTDDEINILFGAAEKCEDEKIQLAAKIILIYTYTGLRANELLKMKKANVDLQARVMRGGSKTKAGRNRTIPIHEKAYPFICEFMELSPKNQMLITEDGQSITYDHFRNTLFIPALEKLGFDYLTDNGKNALTINRARHTFTQRAIESGVQPEALKKIMGHTKITTTIDKYDDVADVGFLSEELKKI